MQTALFAVLTGKVNQDEEDDEPELEPSDLEVHEQPETKELNEFLGHTPLEELGGALLGILIGMIILYSKFWENSMYLEKVHSPEDLKNLTVSQMEVLAGENPRTDPVNGFSNRRPSGIQSVGNRGADPCAPQCLSLPRGQTCLGCGASGLYT